MCIWLDASKGTTKLKVHICLVLPIARVVADLYIPGVAYSLTGYYLQLSIVGGLVSSVDGNLIINN